MAVKGLDGENPHVTFEKKIVFGARIKFFAVFVSFGLPALNASLKTTITTTTCPSQRKKSHQRFETLVQELKPLVLDKHG